ncbi:MAG: glycosylase [Pseudonocardiales bacterium]|nr:glycosylase [Pseudonocardiales bacterium]
MPEGHALHRLANQQTAQFAGRPVRVSSPQGRFAESAARLDGRNLLRVEAHGKHLFQVFDPRDAIVHIHLGLYGKVAAGTGAPPEAKGALRLRLIGPGADGEGQWADLRGATACDLITGPERAAILDRLGPDPLRRGGGTAVDGAIAGARIARSRVAIGALLMDQTVLAGVGNVYRAELLFRHRVDPLLPGKLLPPEVWEAMWADLVVLMRAGVRAGRIVTTERAHRDRRTGPPRALDRTYVYRRTGLPCRICGTEIATAPMVGRNLFWCPGCQHPGAADGLR